MEISIIKIPREGVSVQICVRNLMSRGTNARVPKTFWNHDII